MKPRDLYEMVPESATKDISDLNYAYYYIHVPEIREDDWWKLDIGKNERIEIRTVKYFCFDGRRTWELRTVWFDNRPVMVIQNAGREGDDHDARFVTDKALYDQMVAYMRSLSKEEIVLADIYDIDDEIPDLDKFYGHSLSGSFVHDHG